MELPKTNNVVSDKIAELNAILIELESNFKKDKLLDAIDSLSDLISVAGKTVFFINLKRKDIINN